MAAPSVTSRSTRRLSEIARHVVIPTGIVSTGWPAVEAKCNEWGDKFDVWQQGLGRAILGKRADGKYAATVGGVTLSIPRQVAKTFVVGRIVFALAILFPGLKVLWTAHRTRLSDETFRKLKGLARSKGVAPYVLAVRSANGQQEIEFRNGSRILFGAREQGFGLGFDEVDVIVFDEAQRLTQKALEDMIPAANQSRQPSGALVFYMGTPPRPTDQGEVFTMARDEALAEKRLHKAHDFGEAVEAGDAMYVECSADANVGTPNGPSLDDPAQIEKANPSYPDRTPIESIRRMRKQLKTDDSWRREGLGVWDDNAANGPLIHADQWNPLHVDIAPPSGVQSYGVKFSADGANVALAGARRPDGGPTHVEVIRATSTGDGIGWLADWLSERWRKASVIVIDGKAGAPLLVTELRRRGVPKRKIVTPSVDQVIEAHAGLLEAVKTRDLTHYGQTGLDAVVRAATKRPIGVKTAGGWGWQPIGDDVDVTPLDAVTYAHYGAAAGKAKPPSGDDRTTSSWGGRRAVVA